MNESPFPEERRARTAPSPPLAEFAGGVWLAAAPLRILGMDLASTMTVLRLSGDELLVHSPVAMTPELRGAVDALGRVAHLYLPNALHHLFAGPWAAAYPAARLHAPAGLVRKRSDLRIDRVLGAAEEPAFRGVVDEVCIEGFRLQECALVYRPAATLVVADLVQNVGRPRQTWARIYTGAMGFYDRAALSRMIRWIGFSDRAAARRSIEAVLALDFDRLVVGHGAPIATDARRVLAQAYAWLGKWGQVPISAQR